MAQLVEKDCEFDEFSIAEFVVGDSEDRFQEVCDIDSSGEKCLNKCQFRFYPSRNNKSQQLVILRALEVVVIDQAAQSRMELENTLPVLLLAKLLRVLL